MVQKELSLTKFSFLIICIFTVGCANPKDKKAMPKFEIVDISEIPHMTISETDINLKLLNGVYYFNKKPYDGYIKSYYPSDTLKTIASYLQGKQHGTTKTFFPNGKLASERNYRHGMAYGRHVGFWENGNMKFDFIYFNDRRHGIQKHWYESGSQYYALNFSNDKEDGMQKAWRENGKLYINYEVKDGIRYGLQKSALCYTLKDEQLK
jgi:antitoxin component YwqK of YwqJK toxin-antitoxin module